MGNRKKTLIILCIVMVLLIGVLIIFLTRPSDEQVKEPADDSVNIYNYSIDDLESIELKTNDGQSELFIKDDSYNWIAKDKDYALNQRNLEILSYSIINLTAIGIVEEQAPDDLSPYGLTNPSKTIATLKDGTQLIVYCGNNTPTRSSYYAMVGADSAIYEIYSSYADAFLSEPSDFIDKAIISAVNVEALEQFTLLRRGKETIDIVNMPGSGQVSPIIQFSEFQMIEPFARNHDVSIEKLRLLIDNLNSAITANSVIYDDAADLTQYGLDSPQMQITIKDNSRHVSLMIGGTKDESLVYGMIKGGHIVYTLEKASLESFETVEPIDLILRFVLLANIEAMDKVIVTGYGQEYVMGIQREGLDADPQSSYFVNSNQVEESSFKETYQLAVGMLADGVAVKQTDIADSEVTIKYINNIDGVDNDTVEFVDYDEHFYVAYCNGIDEFVISKQEVEKLFKSLKSFSSNN